MEGETIMKVNPGIEPIPWEDADQLCAAIRQEAEQTWYTAAARWCWDCQQTMGGDLTKRGFMHKPGNRGCYLVNARYAESMLMD
jgi:hypothetical protein